jgi:hypothetical protein
MAYRLPSYCRQRCSGRPDRAYAVINGKRIWLGTYGTEESRARYAELLGQTQHLNLSLSSPRLIRLFLN